ncbi:MAG: hypothetical protein PVJ09_04695 [Candidatus Woesebacteria bacterium]|jgi:hypothetical protein
MLGLTIETLGPRPRPTPPVREHKGRVVIPSQESTGTTLGLSPPGTPLGPRGRERPPARTGRRRLRPVPQPQ